MDWASSCSGRLPRSAPKSRNSGLLARREDRLAAAAAQVEGKKTFLLPIDLTDYGRYDALRSALEEKQPDVVWLFNNAGFGKLGDYGEIDPRDHYDIANLNCAALSAVTGTVLPYMHAGAHIVNVCSIAAFAPTPRMTVYCSTKAFVYSFSKALRAELRKSKSASPPSAPARWIPNSCPWPAFRAIPKCSTPCRAATSRRWRKRP